MRRLSGINENNDILTKIISFFAIVLFLIIVIAKGAYLFDLLPVALAAVGCALLITIVFLWFKIDKIHEIVIRIFSLADVMSNKKKFLILLFVALSTKLLAVFIFQIVSINDNSDINVYVTTSNELAEYGVAKSYANYCYSFSHMYWFSVFLLPVTKIFGVSQFAYSIFLTLILTTSTMLLFDTVCYYCKKSCAFIAFMIFTLLPSQILLPQYVTHEIASLFFLSIAIWLYFKWYAKCDKKIHKFIVLLLTFVSLLFCSAVNAIGLVAIIAFAVVFLIEFVRKHSLKNFLVSVTKMICLLLVFAIGVFILNIIQVNYSEIDYKKINNNKLQWTLYVGSNYESKGQWYLDTRWDNFPDTYDQNEVNKYHQDLISERYNELLSNPEKAITLLKDKLVTIWGNFTYSTGYTNENIINKTMQSFYNKFLFKPFCLVEYLMLTLLSILGLFLIIMQYKQKKGLFYVFCELYLLGTTALLLLTECRNKYIISIVPVFVMTVALMIDMDRSTNNPVTVVK